MGKYLWLLLIFSLFSCYKEEKCPSVIRIPFNVFPIKSEYKIGDTIHFISKYPPILKDERHNEFNFANNVWNFNFSIRNFDASDGYLNTSEYIFLFNQEYNKLEHSLTDSYDSYFGVAVNTDDSITVYISGVLIKEGIISTAISYDTGPPVEASTSCRKGWFYNPPFKIITNYGIYYHLELLYELGIAENNPILADPKSFNETGGYLFKVIP
jgi:hypothetical protein